MTSSVAPDRSNAVAWLGETQSAAGGERGDAGAVSQHARIRHRMISAADMPSDARKRRYMRIVA